MNKKEKLITTLKVVDISDASEESIKNLLKSFKVLKDLKESKNNFLNGDMANEFNEIFARENQE